MSMKMQRSGCTKERKKPKPNNKNLPDGFFFFYLAQINSFHYWYIAYNKCFINMMHLWHKLTINQTEINPSTESQGKCLSAVLMHSFQGNRKIAGTLNKLDCC